MVLGPHHQSFSCQLLASIIAFVLTNTKVAINIAPPAPLERAIHEFRTVKGLNSANSA
jgi:hypothetical protein